MINGQDMDLNIINTFLFHPRKSYQEIDRKDVQIFVGDKCLGGYSDIAKLHEEGKLVDILQEES